LKILVLEYINGGGLIGRSLPASLAAEGGMMLQALLAELKSLDDIELCVPLDTRCPKPAILANHQIIRVGPQQDIMRMLPDLLAEADIFWPIAPESDGILQRLAELGMASNAEVLLSNPATLACCADKYATYKALSERLIPTVGTRLLSQGYADLQGDVVVKIADGVGCQDSFLINAELLPAAVAELSQPHRYVIQPYFSGQAVSLSCLFKQGRAWLLCCNQQQIVLEHGRFNLQGCLVNIENDKCDFYQDLLSSIAVTLPGLWGYIGIDIIETAERGPLVLEINPRLTSSYVGIHQATGINVAEQVLRLRHAQPVLQSRCNQTVRVLIA
jgi:predicted ATP-grasp superfamily ATP-dependent carboligase